MRAEAHEEANAALNKYSTRANGVAGVTAERSIREGNTAEEILKLIEEDEDIDFVRSMIGRHAAITGSVRAAYLLTVWSSTAARIIKVVPRDYKRILMAEARARSENREPAFTELVAVARG